MSFAEEVKKTEKVRVVFCGFSWNTVFRSMFSCFLNTAHHDEV